jgi:hypothetical protein
VAVAFRPSEPEAHSSVGVRATYDGQNMQKLKTFAFGGINVTLVIEAV